MVKFIFEHPFTCLVAGPTQSGKTQFTLKVLQNMKDMITPTPKRIVWCHGQEQPGLDLPEGVEVYEGLGVLDELDGKQPTLLVLDDLMQEAGESQQVCELFWKKSHHENISVIMLIQNLYHQGTYMRLISLNALYIVLMKNPREEGQIEALGRQLCPGRMPFFRGAYRDATKRPHGYLLLTFRQTTSDDLRFLSEIFPWENGYYYEPE